jgi:hypothetical protein
MKHQERAIRPANQPLTGNGGEDDVARYGQQ